MASAFKEQPIYQELEKTLFSDIPYPEDITKLIGNVEPWRAFCKLPQEIKERFTYPDHQDATDAGYIKRSKASDGRDEKEYFHIYFGNRGFMSHYGLDPLIAENPALRDFFTYTDAVYKRAEEFALSLGKEIGIGVPPLAKLIEDKKINMLLRFLHYTPQETDTILATQHYDRSLYTLHLYESEPGLQFLDLDMVWKDAPIRKGTTVVFNGYRNEKLPNSNLQKTWHRVIRKSGEPERYSVVLFVWSEAVESYPRDARAQDEAPSYHSV